MPLYIACAVKFTSAAFCIWYRFHMIPTETSIISLNSVNRLFFVTVKCSVVFAVRTKFLNIIWTNFGTKGLNSDYVYEAASTFDKPVVRSASKK
jgi:hypothetical protein